MTKADFHALYEKVGVYLPTDHSRVKKANIVDDRIKLVSILAYLGGDSKATIADQVFRYTANYFDKIFKHAAVLPSLN